METVLERPRYRSNIFDRAKKFFTNIFHRRKTKSKVEVNNKVVENTNARVIPVEDMISLLSDIYPLESLVELYENRVTNTEKQIAKLKENLQKSSESDKESIQNKINELDKNLKVDSYILEKKRNELKKVQEESQKQDEEMKKTSQEEAQSAKETEKTKETHNAHYTEIYNHIKYLMEEKVRLSNARLNRLNNINNYVKNITNNPNDFNGSLAYLIHFNESFNTNAKVETLVDNQLTGFTKEMYSIDPHFNFNQEFSELSKQIAVPTDELIRSNVTNIIEKQYLLEQQMSNVEKDKQEIIKAILKELDHSLSNLKYNLINPKILENIVIEVNKEVANKYSKNKEPLQKAEEKQKVKEQKVEQSKQEVSSKEEIKDKLLNALKKEYNKINSLNDIFSNPINMTYNALIYFEGIAVNTYKKIDKIKAGLRSMPNVSPDEIKDLEVFPGDLQNFINLHKEKILRASNELMSLKAKKDEEKSENILQRINLLQSFINAERKLVERRLIFEKRKDNNINILEYLSQLSEGASLPKEEPTPKEPTQETPIPEESQETKENFKIVRTKINVNQIQRINQIKSLVETLPLYQVVQCKKSIKIKINKHAHEELRKLLGEIKVIVNNNKGLNGVKVTSTENKEGYEVQKISNLKKLDNLKVIVSTNNYIVESEEIYDKGHSL